MFKEMMEQIEEFLENTPKDIYEFSIIFEDMLVDDYYEMYEEQPEAMELLAVSYTHLRKIWGTFSRCAFRSQQGSRSCFL